MLARVVEPLLTFTRRLLLLSALAIRRSRFKHLPLSCLQADPTIQVYWLAAVSLFALTPVAAAPSDETPVAWYAEKSFQKAAQGLGKNLFYQGDVSYLEAVNQGVISRVCRDAHELISRLPAQQRSRTRFSAW